MQDGCGERRKSEEDHLGEARERIIRAALPHVLFDGWSDVLLADAARASDVPLELAALAFPRGAVDLALGFHRAADGWAEAVIRAEDDKAMRYRDRIAQAVRLRLEVVEQHKEAVRPGVSLLSLPHLAGEGSAAVWQTADMIWRALGDTSQDVNWYSKRATLCGVFAATVLFWLGDESEEHSETWAFLDRRIKDVMRFEKVKATVKNGPLGRIIGCALACAKPPMAAQGAHDMPGYWPVREEEG